MYIHINVHDNNLKKSLSLKERRRYNGGLGGRENVVITLYRLYENTISKNKIFLKPL